ncbi:MAG TPA: GNAT family N-acetyltransferase [Candidatus Eremiobacteraceae bacterium]|nr:GNAT family N-acetyltransferase [Candidatus Eremiobacteraceae bacterium]
MSLKVYCAGVSQIPQAYRIVSEYYEVASVQVREDRDEFEREYFADGAGIRLAESGGEVVGCVALRRLPEVVRCAEIKRMYVHPSYRGLGVSDLLLSVLEDFARRSVYAWLYLDTAADMKAAARFYRRKGFEDCDRYNQNPQAALFMRKKVGAD